VKLKGHRSVTRARADGSYRRGAGFSSLMVLLFEERSVDKTHSFRHAGLCRLGGAPTRSGSTVPGSTDRLVGRAGEVVLVEHRYSPVSRMAAVTAVPGVAASEAA
jgi:hypothetical protein